MSKKPYPKERYAAGGKVSPPPSAKVYVGAEMVLEDEARRKLEYLRYGQECRPRLTVRQIFDTDFTDWFELLDADGNVIGHSGSIYNIIKLLEKTESLEKGGKADIIWADPKYPETFSKANPQMGKGGRFPLEIQRVKNIEKFLDKFPDDANSWSQATDELPDLHNDLADYFPGYKGNIFTNAGGTLPMKVRSSPANRNTIHKRAIRNLIPKLSDADFDKFYADHKEWFDNAKYAAGGAVASWDKAEVDKITAEALSYFKEKTGIADLDFKPHSLGEGLTRVWINPEHSTAHYLSTRPITQAEVQKIIDAQKAEGRTAVSDLGLGAKGDVFVGMQVTNNYLWDHRNKYNVHLNFYVPYGSGHGHSDQNFFIYPKRAGKTVFEDGGEMKKGGEMSKRQAKHVWDYAMKLSNKAAKEAEANGIPANEYEPYLHAQRMANDSFLALNKGKIPDEYLHHFNERGEMKKGGEMTPGFLGYFLRPSKFLVQKAQEYGLDDIENEDLSIAGLQEKMRVWDEKEHGVEAYIYDMTAKELIARGSKMPDDIRRLDDKGNITDAKLIPSLTFFQAWQMDMEGFTLEGNFVTHLMQAYAAADGTNKRVLETSFPEYFLKNVMQK